MTTPASRSRPFLNTSEAEKTADLGELRDSLAEAARNAERLGLPEVKEHVEAALAYVAVHVEGEGGA